MLRHPSSVHCFLAASRQQSAAASCCFATTSSIPWPATADGTPAASGGFYDRSLPVATAASRLISVRRTMVTGGIRSSSSTLASSMQQWRPHSLAVSSSSSSALVMARRTGLIDGSQTPMFTAAPGGHERPVDTSPQRRPAAERAMEAADAADQSSTNFTKSRHAFGDRRKELVDSYAGAAEMREVSFFENLYWNYIRYFFTKEYMIGKDRYGNRFIVRWYFQRGRHEERKCYRLDNNKRHQPYGALPTDHKLWEAWLRHWRHDPPTPEEEEFYREKKRESLGPHVVGDEELEDTVVRALAHTKQASATLQELDPDENYNNFINNTDQRAKDANPAKEMKDRTWTQATVRGDVFYNEEEVEQLRTTLSHLYRDKEWQTLELKRQLRSKKPPIPVRKPGTETGEDGTIDPMAGDGQPMNHQWERLDAGVPFVNGVPDLTTPDLEKLKFECDALEEERVNLRKELGLTDLGDFRDGRPPADKGHDPFMPPPTSKRWKPKVWSESWGTMGGQYDSP